MNEWNILQFNLYPSLAEAIFQLYHVLLYLDEDYTFWNPKKIESIRLFAFYTQLSFSLILQEVSLAVKGEAEQKAESIKLWGSPHYATLAERDPTLAWSIRAVTSRQQAQPKLSMFRSLCHLNWPKMLPIIWRDKINFLCGLFHIFFSIHSFMY